MRKVTMRDNGDFANNNELGDHLTLVDVLKKDISHTNFIRLAAISQQKVENEYGVSSSAGIGAGGGKVHKVNYGDGEIEVRECGAQTEDFNFIDYDALMIQNAEVYMFERVSRKMRKIIVETDP